MSDKDKVVIVQPLLDEIAAQSMASSEGQLRAQLLDAGVEPGEEIRDLKTIASKAIARYRRRLFEDLPDQVPDDPVEVRVLLDRLLTMPKAPRQGFTLAFRDKTRTSERDVRILTMHLLELLKRQGDA